MSMPRWLTGQRGAQGAGVGHAFDLETLLLADR